MAKQIIIYGLLVVALTTAGVVASLAIFGESAEDVLPKGTINQTQTMPPKPIVENSNVEEQEKSPDDDTVKVLSVKGSARRYQDGNDNWDELAVGEALEKKDRVKTGDNARITLGVGKKSKLELTQRSELSVGETSAKDHKFKLVRGRISVDYKEKNRKLRIENQDGSAAAEADEGIFTVLNTGTTVAVATKTGSVDLFADGQRVAVRAGQQSVAARGSGPSRPTPIAVDVMLRVMDPGCRIQREKFIVLRGRTDPGAIVYANGNLAQMRPDGRFLVRVPLRVGKNSIVVNTEDSSGNQKHRTYPCVTVDPGAAIKKIDIKWGPSERQEDS